jgi:hypothetical protein
MSYAGSNFKHKLKRKILTLQKITKPKMKKNGRMTDFIYNLRFVTEGFLLLPDCQETLDLI